MRLFNSLSSKLICLYLSVFIADNNLFSSMNMNEFELGKGCGNEYDRKLYDSLSNHDSV